jgi:hypothetical protein
MPNRPVGSITRASVRAVNFGMSVVNSAWDDFLKVAVCQTLLEVIDQQFESLLC